MKKILLLIIVILTAVILIRNKGLESMEEYYKLLYENELDNKYM
ncbi:hypothetical protein N039_12540 [Staphylococcus sp. EGD-HP3]|nr:hypothetical protein N039_12540 [Staphylococcus sp. EGD-HP3]